MYLDFMHLHRGIYCVIWYFFPTFSQIFLGCSLSNFFIWQEVRGQTFSILFAIGLSYIRQVHTYILCGYVLSLLAFCGHMLGWYITNIWPLDPTWRSIIFYSKLFVPSAIKTQIILVSFCLLAVWITRAVLKLLQFSGG